MSHACTPILVGLASRFWGYCYSQKRPNFPFGPWIVHGGQKLELAQKNHASRG